MILQWNRQIHIALTASVCFGKEYTLQLRIKELADPSVTRQGYIIHLSKYCPRYPPQAKGRGDARSKPPLGPRNTNFTQVAQHTHTSTTEKINFKCFVVHFCTVAHHPTKGVYMRHASHIAQTNQLLPAYLCVCVSSCEQSPNFKIRMSAACDS